ncbi:MAG: flagellar assembly protein A [bacterium]
MEEKGSRRPQSSDVGSGEGFALPRDGSVEGGDSAPPEVKVAVAISPDEMKAYATFKPVRSGGIPATYESVLGTLRGSGVVWGIRGENIRDALREVSATNRSVPMVTVAEGALFDIGRRARIKYYLPLQDDLLRDLSRGRIGLTAGDGVWVKKGHLIAESFAGEPPRNGRTVTGKEVVAKGRRDKNFIGGEGVKEIGRGDRREFVANESGYVVVSNRDESVEISIAPAVGVEEVGQSTGLSSPLEPVDGGVKISVSEDEMAARASFIPPRNGGKMLTYRGVMEKLRKLGIVFGLKTDSIKAAIDDANSGRRVDDVIVAEGSRLEVGRPPRISYKLPLASDGIYYMLVDEGAILATSTPGQPGVNGRTVRGKVVSPPPLSEGVLFAGDNVRRVKRSDRIEYLAACRGIVELENNTLSVIPCEDGRAEVSLSEDKVRAYISLIPPSGLGRKVRLNEVYMKLREMGVIYGIKDDVIERAVEDHHRGSEPIRGLLVAEGIPPTPGQDGRIEYKFDLSRRRFKELSDGRVDYREREDIANVKKGDLLAVFIPPVRGTSGISVERQIVSPPEPEAADPALFVGDNVELVDGRKFVSTISGRAAVGADGKISVVETFECDNVDYSTGNIRFVGDVVVRGDVLDGFRVEADGNVLIGGSVGAATIVSGGDVVVKGGFVGRSKGVIRASGGVFVAFVENGRIESGGDVIVGRASLHSKIIADSRVVVVENKGTIIGGMISALGGVEAKVVGAPAETFTRIMVGFDYRAVRRVNLLGRNLLRLEERMRRILPAIAAIKGAKGKVNALSPRYKGIYKKLIGNKVTLENKIKRAREERKDLLESIRSRRGGELIVRDMVYPGVRVTIGFLSESIRAPEGPTIFALADGGDFIKRQPL